MPKKKPSGQQGSDKQKREKRLAAILFVLATLFFIFSIVVFVQREYGG
ncbi:MAG: hypothetical protein OEW11_01600 [Nitrospirota bacterium]|nr:hypothetical protein [Nitrospirota bacterium]